VSPPVMGIYINELDDGQREQRIAG
jgi:hypothetical protein